MVDPHIIVDQEDQHILDAYRWRVLEQNGYKRVLRRTHTRAMGKQFNVSLAEQLIGKREGMVIDHINGNPLDNRRSNLRHCTQTQNMWNRRPQKNRSGVKGVYKIPWGWRAEIQVNGKRYNVDKKNFEDAVLARKELEKKHHGEFAWKG